MMMLTVVPRFQSKTIIHDPDPGRAGQRKQAGVESGGHLREGLTFLPFSFSLCGPESCTNYRKVGNVLIIVI
jgi:hypothetical protein